MHYDLPGNIRKLENIIEYSFILCPRGFIQPQQHLPEPFAPTHDKERRPATVPTTAGPSPSLAEIEENAIATSLARNKWKKMATCRGLGISKDTLRRKISRYHLSPDDNT